MALPPTISLEKYKSICASSIRVLSPAKINLYLNITGKYRDGFHRLESVFERISLCDFLKIEAVKTANIELSSNIKSLTGKNNLVFKAAALLRKRYKLKNGFKIYLHKNIPLGSGLGGGSSNAASALLGINKLMGLGISKEDLYKIGRSLGSDVNFFISESKFALAEGRGERITPWKIDRTLRHLIIWPNISISTARVYSEFRGKLTKFFNNANILQYALKEGDFFLLSKGMFNALARSAFSLSEDLRKANDLLFSKGIFALLTGSGGAFFTIGDISYSEIKKILPHRWFIVEVQTF